ncbi:MAG: LTA synthase family protein [Oscillospiraceae bacterium]|nr:LTA synthase family protein [Oscillospiraceae bacterium]
MRLSFSLNKKRLLAAVIFAVLALCLCVYLKATWKFTFLICLLFLAGGFWNVRVSGRLSALVMPVLALAASLLTVFLAQEANGLRGLLAPKLLVMGTACVLLVILLLHVLLLCLKKDMRPAIIIACGLLLFLSIVNFYTFDTRGSGLSPTDLLGATTALHVLDHYTLSFSPHILIAVLVFAAAAFLLTGIRVDTLPALGLRWAGTLASLLVLAITLRFTLGDPHSWQWQNSGASINGFILNFFTEINESIITPPAGYSAAKVAALEAQYEGDETVSEPLPHIVVIMNEAYADLRAVGELETDVPFMPFADSLTENTVKGFALSSVYGGMTVNSEYEFLTGNSMALIRPFAIPFMQFIRQPIWSLNTWLESLGYQSFASHPAAGVNWNREKVYPLLGFDQYEFDLDYPDAETLRNFVRDDAVYDHIIRHFEQSAGSGPQFIYTVTLQNHGAYGQDVRFDEPVHVLGTDCHEAEVYLSCMLASDRALQRLVEYFENTDERVILLIYGDHQPAMPDSFLQELHGKSFDTLEEQMLLYQIPYLIWANYDIEEKTPELTSINYLSNLLLETAGLPLPPYNRFLDKAQASIPAINAFCYRTADGQIRALTEADGAEKDILDTYSLLEYNAAFDRRDRNSFFFPLGS